jgi:hypothetical protein
MTEFGALIDPCWIEQALQATGKASIRRRKLPAEHAVCLSIAPTCRVFVYWFVAAIRV